MHLKRELPFYVIILLILVGLSYYFYSDTISLFPSFIHAWTQTDRFALTLCFLQNGMNLFQPCTFNLITVDGITAVDLPIFEYTIAWIMKLTGSEAPLIQRTFTLFYSFIGYVFLYKSGRELGASAIRSIALVVFTFTCPVIAYYQAGFVPSPYGLSSVFIGYYFYICYIKNNQISKLGWAIFFLTLASIYRTPFNIFLFAVLLQLIGKTMMHRRVQRKAWLYFGVAYALIIGSTFYKKHLGDLYGNMFLTELLYPESFEQFQTLLIDIWQTWKWQYFTRYHYTFMVLAVLVVFFKMIFRKGWSRIQEKWLFLTGLILAGGALYFVLMMRQFPAHDYYLMDSLYPGIIMFVMLGISLIPKKTIWNIGFVVLATGTLIGGTIDSKEIQEQRYTHNFWDDGETTRQNFEGSADFLDSLGISREAKILVLDAYSTNAPLILMKRWGYTVQHTTKENLQNALNDFNYDYVVIQDQYLPHAIVYNYPDIVKHLKPLGHNGKISVYKYSEQDLHQNMYDLLPIENSKKWELNFNDSIHAGWENQYDVQLDSSLGNCITIDGEYGPVFEQKASDLSGNKLLFEMTFINPDAPKDFAISANINDGFSTLYYHSISLRFHQTENPEKFQCMFVLPENLKGDETVKCHLFNGQRLEIVALEFSVMSY